MNNQEKIAKAEALYNSFRRKEEEIWKAREQAFGAYEFLLSHTSAEGFSYQLLILANAEHEALVKNWRIYHEAIVKARALVMRLKYGV